MSLFNASDLNFLYTIRNLGRIATASADAFYKETPLSSSPGEAAVITNVNSLLAGSHGNPNNTYAGDPVNTTNVPVGWTLYDNGQIGTSATSNGLETVTFQSGNQIVVFATGQQEVTNNDTGNTLLQAAANADINTRTQIDADQVPTTVFELVDLYKQIEKDQVEKGNPNAQIVLAGHSLGGAIAKMAATLLQNESSTYYNSVKSISFDSLGVGHLLNNLGSNYNQSNIINFYNNYDELGLDQGGDFNNYGTQYYTPTLGTTNFFDKVNHAPESLDIQNASTNLNVADPASLTYLRSRQVLYAGQLALAELPANPLDPPNPIVGDQSAQSNNDVLTGTKGNDSIQGLIGDDILFGDRGDDTLIGGTGDDTLYDSLGNDTFKFSAGDGHDVIKNISGVHDTVLFSDISVYDIAATLTSGIPSEGVDAPNLTLFYGNSDQLIVEHHQVDQNQIQIFQADDGYLLLGDNLNDDFVGTNANEKLYGFDGNDLLTAGEGNDVLIGGTGDDTLRGGLGNDYYVFDANWGHDVIQDIIIGYDSNGLPIFGSSASNNIDFEGIAASDLASFRQDNDLVIVNKATLDTLEIDGYYTAQNAFSSNINLNLPPQFSTSPINESYLYYAGDIYYESSDEVEGTLDGGNQNVSGALDTAQNIAGDFFIHHMTGDATINGGNDQVQKPFVDLSGGIQQVSSLLYGDSSLANGYQLTSYGGNDLLKGFAAYDVTGDDYVTNTDQAVLYGGNDTIESSGGNYSHTRAYGSFVYGDSNVGASIALPGTVESSLIGGNDIISTNNVNSIIYGDGVIRSRGGNAPGVLGSSLHFYDHLEGGDDIASGGGGNDIIFGDGDISSSIQATDYDNDFVTIYHGNTNFDGGNDVLLGGAGKDTIMGDGTLNTFTLYGNQTFTNVQSYYKGGNDSISGGMDDDTLIGDGAMVTTNSFNPDPKVQWGSDLLEGDSGNDLLIGDGAAIPLSYVTYGNPNYLNVEALTFNYKQAGNNVINPTSYKSFLALTGGNDTLIGGTGNDTLWGGGGNDRYEFNSGDGQDLIMDGGGISPYYDGGNDTVVFGKGITSNNISVSYNANDLIIQYGANDSIRIENQLNSLMSGRHIESFQFADGVTLTADQLASRLSSSASAITGDGTNNYLRGNATYQHIQGFAGDDYIIGASLGDTLDGGEGNDTIDAGTGNDTVIGGTGDDSFIVNSAGVTLFENANEGSDTAYVNHLQSDFTFSTSGNDFIASYGGLDWLTAKDQVTSNGLDYLHFSDGSTVSVASIIAGLTPPPTPGILLDGTTSDDTLVGGDGNDTLNGNAGNDSLSGGNGNDRLDTGEGDDFAYGDSGNDTLIGYNGNDSLYGADGDDSISGDKGNDFLYGGNGNDSLDGGDAADLMTGDAGDDTLYGRAESDTLFGGVGADLLDGGEDDDSLDGGDGNDTLIGYTGNDILYGVAGSDSLQGGDGNDSLFGGEGDDSLDGGNGDDALNGDTGNDTLYGQLGNDTISGGDGNDLVDGGEDNDVLLGNAGDDTLVGYTGNDTLSGDDGNDVLNGGDGSDTLEGGNGDDSLIGEAGNDTLYGRAGADTLSGGDGDDLVDAGEDSDLLYGNNGTDTLIGYSGNDTLYGGDGNDSLEGGDGDDSLSGDSGDDTLYARSGNDTLYGGDGADYLNGGEDTDVIYGGAGNDILDGYSGNDTLIAGDGNDSLDGGDGDDSLSGDAGNDTLMGRVGNDTLLGGEGDDLVDAGEDNDQLYGSSGNDTLIGYSGSDTLTGGTGNDVLNGGDGDDTYLFTQGDGMDSIFDSAGVDTLSFDGSVMQSAIAFFQDANNHLEIGFTNASGDQVILDNVNDIEQIQLSNGNYLTNADLNLVIQQMSSYATNNAISLTSLNDVENNANLMGMINGAWHAA